jgi:para-nitrobenzyl esterase
MEGENMNRIRFILLLVTIFSLATKLHAQVNCSDPVSTVSGQLRGGDAETPGSCVWKGIPFAAAPVKDLRWKAPQPVPAWSSVRDAKTFGPLCMQKGMTSGEKLGNKAGMSEDCLYLNVWRPKKAAPLQAGFPVMVWIHGGGYTGGVSSTPMYWGDRLAPAGDVVVVSTNYRLNIFGFFSSPALRSEDPNQSTGNYAFLDQVAALKWVQANIKNFGGDPNNVTIFGESAGGFSICTLVATPTAKGLFKHAIMESGGCTMSEDLKDGYEASRPTAEKLGCKLDDLKCLRALPAKKILDAMPGGMAQHGNIPHHDGYVLTATPLAMIESGNYNHVPFLAGTNREEFGNMLRLYPKISHIRPKDYEKPLVDTMKFSKADADEFAKLYPLSANQNRPVVAYGHAVGADAVFACPTYDGVLAASKQQTPTYLYRFDYDHMKAGKYFGAAHSFEMPFIFDAFDRMPMNLFYNDKNVVPAKKLSKVMQGYWLNFARTGNPNGPGLPDWPLFNADTQSAKIFDNDVRNENIGLADRCAFWGKHSMKERPALK